MVAPRRKRAGNLDSAGRERGVCVLGNKNWGPSVGFGDGLLATSTYSWRSWFCVGCSMQCVVWVVIACGVHRIIGEADMHVWPAEI